GVGGEEGAAARVGDAAEAAREPGLRPAAAPGAVRRFRFRHPTASGKTIAAAGFVEAARTEGVLILTHRRLLVDQFRRELRDHGYGSRITAIILGDSQTRKTNPITVPPYAWFPPHRGEGSP